jgi:hypothetical protein
MARKATATATKPDAATLQAMADADAFLRAGRERNAAAKEYERAKAALKKWLGPDPSRPLPDGRTVILAVTERAGYEVAPGTTSTLSVLPSPPLPAV